MVSKGMSGSFSFKAPLTTIDDSFSYTISSLVPIREMIANNLNPKETIYAPFGILDKYEEDVENNIDIVSIQKEGSFEYIYLPISYITPKTDTKKIKFVEKLLIFSIGSVPVDYDLENLKGYVKDTISGMSGLNVVIKELNNSAIELKDEVDFLEWQETTNYLMANNKSYEIRYNELVAEMDNLYKINENLNKALNISVSK